MGTVTNDRAPEDIFSSHAIVALSFSAGEAAKLCSAAGISVVSITIRDAASCRIECLTGEGADELRLRFADHVLVDPAS